MQAHWSTMAHQVEINQFNLNAGLLNRHKQWLHHNAHWHKILVENVEGLDRDAVLRTLMKFCNPAHFIPVKYESSKNTASFLLKNCGAAIEKFCQQNLIVMHPFRKDTPFKITIKLCYANSNDLKINIQVNIVSILNKRFNQETGILNLENFAKDPELQEYCALSQPKLFFYILHLTKVLHFKVLKLSHNDIESLQPMEALDGIKTSIVVDLRNNNIKEISELENMKHLNITELWLDGNPICNNYDEVIYGKVVKEHLEKLERLDGVSLMSKGFLQFRRNFLCNLTGHDLVDQFLEHYFTLYDAQNRSVLDGLYHKDALFSLTSMYIPSQTTSASAKLSPYKKVSRNLKHMSDFSKTTQCLFSGPYDILKVLSTLPVTEHDPFSFTVDLMMYTETTAVLVVCGVFREYSESLLESDRLLGFTRTFVLLAGKDREYSVINEMLHVTNATTTQAARSFKQVRLPRPQFIYLPKPQSHKEKLDMAEALKAITGLKVEWSRKCLEECNYDLKEALSLFVDLFKVDKIPKAAFASAQETVGQGYQENQGNLDFRNAFTRLDSYGNKQVIDQPKNLTSPVVRKPQTDSLTQWMSGIQNFLPASDTGNIDRTVATESGYKVLSARNQPINQNPSTMFCMENVEIQPPAKLSRRARKKKLQVHPTYIQIPRVYSETSHVIALPTSKENKKMNNTVQSGQLSPDLLWDEFSTQRRNSSKNTRKQVDLTEIVDLLSSQSSSEEEDSTNVTTQRKSITSRMNQTAPPPQSSIGNMEHRRKLDVDFTKDLDPFSSDDDCPTIEMEIEDNNPSNKATTSNAKEQDPKKNQNRTGKGNPVRRKLAKKEEREERFIEEFRRFIFTYDTRSNLMAQEAAFQLMKNNRFIQMAYDKMFDHYYKTNLKEARILKNRLVDLLKEVVSNKTFTINVELKAAECELQYGDHAVGHSEYKRLIAQLPREIHPVTNYCRTLLQLQKIDEVKSLIKPFLSPSHPLRKQMWSSIKSMEIKYNVRLVE